MTVILADVFARCERSGVRLFLNSATDQHKLQASGKGNPPAHLIKRVGEVRGALTAALPTLVLDRKGADAAIAAAKAPPDVTPAQWQEAIDGLWVFVAAGHAAAAEAAGWLRGELFAVPPRWSRVDLCGAGLAIGDREVVDVTSAEIRIRTASGATLAFYRKPEIDYRVAYEAHLKSTRGNYKPDSEEAHLRALERAVFFFRNNNPAPASKTPKPRCWPLSTFGRQGQRHDRLDGEGVSPTED